MIAVDGEEKEGGYTLIELLVSIGLLAVLGGIIATTMITTTRTVAKASTKDNQSDRLGVATQEMDKIMRTAVRFNSTTSEFLTNGSTVGGRTVANNGREVWLYANINNAAAATPGPTNTTLCGPQVVHFYVDASNRLIEQRTLPDTTSTAGAWTYTGQPQINRTLAFNVQTPGGGVPQLFTYYTVLGTTALNGSDSLATLSDTTSGSVGDVLVQLTSKTTGAQGESASVSEGVRLVNADTPAGSGAGC